VGFRDYYRQFEEMGPDEISAQLRAQRDEEKRRALSRTEPLDLSGSAWHEPPHPDAVNAATFALRRALNAYPDAAGGGVPEALAAQFGLEPDHVVLGHGAGELLRSLCATLPVAGGDVLVAWPGWQPLPELLAAVGGRAVPVAPDVRELGAAAAGGARVVVLSSPADPTGVVTAPGAVRELCGQVPEGTLVVVDEALAEFAAPEASSAPLAGELANLVVLRSFSKAHAMAGLRAGAALGPPELVARLGPSGGISSPALAAASWAVSEPGRELAARRRAAAAAAHRRLADALDGSPLSAAPAEVPFAWISSTDEGGPELAARLATRQVFVAPGRLWGDERHVRAQLRTPEAIDRLAAAFLG
jgi:histidinol-phosphate/aromatic aminotransferase/cobyric acid decarboxylase-like protein